LQLATAGKDVMWMPSSRAISMAMLHAAKTLATDLVYDLGSGDGIIPILAAQHFGARAVGIEYNGELVELSRRNAIRAGVADRISFRQADLFQVDFSEATVVTLYLGEALNAKLLPRLEKLRPGTRVVSNRFDLGSWRPDQMITEVPNELAMLWVVPAGLQGRWRVPAVLDLESDTVSIVQSHQMISVQINRRGINYVLGEGRILGNEVDLELQRADQQAPTRLKGRLTQGGKTIRFAMRQRDPSNKTQDISFERL
jgi:SAM-dependent methyltransferase